MRPPHQRPDEAATLVGRVGGDQLDLPAASSRRPAGWRTRTSRRAASRSTRHGRRRRRRRCRRARRPDRRRRAADRRHRPGRHARRRARRSGRRRPRRQVAARARPSAIHRPSMPPVSGGPGVGCRSVSDPDAPPPPPPNLAPPPGYAAYTASPSAVVTLRRVGGMRTALLVLLGVYAVVMVVQVVPCRASPTTPGTSRRTDHRGRLRGVAGALRVRRRGVLPAADRRRRADDRVAVPRRQEPPDDRPPADVDARLGDLRMGPAAARPVHHPAAQLHESWKAADPDVPPATIGGAPTATAR